MAHTMTAERDWLSPAEIAQQWGVSIDTVRRLLRSGALPLTRIGNQRRIAIVDKLAYEHAQRVQAKSPEPAPRGRPRTVPAQPIQRTRRQG